MHQGIIFWHCQSLSIFDHNSDNWVWSDQNRVLRFQLGTAAILGGFRFPERRQKPSSKRKGRNTLSTPGHQWVRVEDGLTTKSIFQTASEYIQHQNSIYLTTLLLNIDNQRSLTRWIRLFFAIAIVTGVNWQACGRFPE